MMTEEGFQSEMTSGDATHSWLSVMHQHQHALIPFYSITYLFFNFYLILTENALEIS